jgi:hypothetical protein
MKTITAPEHNLILDVTMPNSKYNPLSIVISVRKEQLGSDAAGDLTQKDIIHHAPGIGKK